MDCVDLWEERAVRRPRPAGFDQDPTCRICHRSSTPDDRVRYRRTFASSLKSSAVTFVFPSVKRVTVDFTRGIKAKYDTSGARRPRARKAVRKKQPCQATTQCIPPHPRSSSLFHIKSNAATMKSAVMAVACAAGAQAFVAPR